MAAPPGHQDSWHTLGAAIDTISGVLDRGFMLGTSRVTVGSILAALVVLLLALLASRLLRGAMRRYAQRYEGSQPAMYALSQTTHYVVLAVGVLVALSVARVPLAELGLFAGALGVGLGFGLREIFANFIGGLVILFERSIKVGDFVELANGVHGQVRSIHARATRVTTNDNIDIMVPNAKFMSDNVVNLTWRDVSRRAHIAFRAPYGADKEMVRKAALEAAEAVPFTLTGDEARKPQVWLTGFGESAMDFALVVWLNAGAARRYRGVIAAYNWALDDALARHDLELPFPQRDLHVKSWLGAGTGETPELSGTRSRATRPQAGGAAPA